MDKNIMKVKSKNGKDNQAQFPESKKNINRKL